MVEANSSQCQQFEETIHQSSLGRVQELFQLQVSYEMQFLSSFCLLSYQATPSPSFVTYFIIFSYINHDSHFAACNKRTIMGTCKMGTQFIFICIIKDRETIEVYSIPSYPILSYSVISLPLSPPSFYSSHISQLIIYISIGQYTQILIIFLIELS